MVIKVNDYSLLIQILLVIFAFSFLMIILSAILPFTWSKRTFMLWFWLMFVSLAVMAFYAEPSVSDDLYRHYDQIDNARKGITRDVSLPVWELICALIAHTNFNGLLPFITVIAVAISLYSSMLLHMEQINNGRTLATYVVWYFGFCSIFAMISGIRNTLVFALWSFAYFRFYRTNRKVKFYVMVLITCMIHLVPIIATLILLLSEYYTRINKLLRYILLLAVCTWPMLLSMVSKIFGSLDIGYLRLIALKIDGYIGETAYTENNSWYILLYLQVVIILFLIILIYRELDNNYRGFVLIYVIMAIASAVMFPILLDRMTMLLGFISLPIVDRCFRNKLAAFIRMIMNIVMLLAFAFYFNALVSHITFGGLNIYEIIH